MTASTTALNVLEGLIEATYTRARRSLLTDVNIQIEKLRLASEAHEGAQGRPL